MYFSRIGRSTCPSEIIQLKYKDVKSGKLYRSYATLNGKSVTDVPRDIL